MNIVIVPLLPPFRYSCSVSRHLIDTPSMHPPTFAIVVVAELGTLFLVNLAGLLSASVYAPGYGDRAVLWRIPTAPATDNRATRVTYVLDALGVYHGTCVSWSCGNIRYPRRGRSRGRVGHQYSFPQYARVEIRNASLALHCSCSQCSLSLAPI